MKGLRSFFVFSPFRSFCCLSFLAKSQNIKFEIPRKRLPAGPEWPAGREESGGFWARGLGAICTGGGGGGGWEGTGRHIGGQTDALAGSGQVRSRPESEEKEIEKGGSREG